MKGKIIFVMILFTIASASAFAPANFEFNTSQSSGLTISKVSSPSIIYSSQVMLKVETDKITGCKYSQHSGMPYEGMEGTFNNFGKTQEALLSEVSDGENKKYVRCKDGNGSLSPLLEAIFYINSPITAEITLSENSPINEGQYEVTLTTSKTPSEVPLLSYSLDGTGYTMVPLYGSGSIWKGFIIIPEDAGNKVGSFKFSGKVGSVSGQTITSGGVFLVDTVKPEPVTVLKATGLNGMIKLEWYLEEDVKDIKVYRSTSANVRAVDYYKTLAGGAKYFTDTDVENGNTYYYRITGVDEAGNEADLSVEVSATSLSSAVSANSGLAIELLGKVDGALTSIKSAIDMTEEIESSWNSKSEKERKIFSDLKLDRDITNSKAELNALKKEVESYKNQNINSNELDKKLSAAEVKLNTIRRNVPETLNIVEEKEFSRSMERKEVERSILSVMPDITENEMEESVKQSLEAISETGIRVDTYASNVDIIYSDGSRRSISLIREEIDSGESGQEANLVLEAAQSLLEGIEFKTSYNERVKEGIYLFDAETQEIIYSINRHVALSSVEDATIALVSFAEPALNRGITGYAIFSGSSEGSGQLALGALVIAGLAGYLIFIKFKGKAYSKISEPLEEIRKAARSAEEGDYKKAEEIYRTLSHRYMDMNEKEKRLIAEEIVKLNNKIHYSYCVNKLKEMKDGGRVSLEEIEAVYDKLPEIYRKELSRKIEEARNEN